MNNVSAPRIGRLITLALALTLTAVFAFAAAAAAGVLVVHDLIGDNTSRSDIRRVVINNSAARDRFVVRVRLDQVVYGADLNVYVDIRRDNPGPEWRMAAAADSEWSLYRVDAFGQLGTLAKSCGRVSFSKDGPPAANWRAPRACLKVGHAVRVSVLVKDPGHGSDWSLDRRVFSPWVRAGS